MILAYCTCGERYELRDGVAGRTVRCLTCSGPVHVPGRPATPQRRPEGRPPDPSRGAWWVDVLR